MRGSQSNNEEVDSTIAALRIQAGLRGNEAWEREQVS